MKEVVDKVIQQRGKTHGSYMDNCAEFAIYVRRLKYYSPSDPRYLALSAIGQKMARAYNAPVTHYDNQVDIAGYAKLSGLFDGVVASQYDVYPLFKTLKELHLAIRSLPADMDDETFWNTFFLPELKSLLCRLESVGSKTLCVDLGNHWGYAVVSEGCVIAHGSHKCNQKLAYGGRLLEFRKHIELIKQDHLGISAVRYELVSRHVGTQAAHAYGAFRGALLTAAEEFGWQVGEYGVTEIKKSFTGSGKADKAAVIAECLKRGHNLNNDNEADAVAIAYKFIGEAF